MKVQSSKFKVQSYKVKLRTILFIFSFLTFNFAFLTFNLHSARAQGLSLSISPPILEVIIKPGKSVTQAFKIANDGEPTIVTAKIGELTEYGLKDDPSFTTEKWISLVNTDIRFDKPFLLKSKESRQLILKISPPSGTSQKDYYRVLYFTTKPNPALDSSQTSISQSLGSPLIITVTSTGLLAKGAQISKFEIPTLADSFEPLKTNIEIKNTGDSYFRPIGNIILTGPVGRGSYTISPNIILAQQTRKITTVNLFESEEPEVSLTLPGIFLGKYNLTVDFTLDQGTIRIMQTKTFYAFPWKIGSVFVIMLVILVKIFARKKRQ